MTERFELGQTVYMDGIRYRVEAISGDRVCIQALVSLSDGLFLGRVKMSHVSIVGFP